MLRRFFNGFGKLNMGAYKTQRVVWVLYEGENPAKNRLAPGALRASPATRPPEGLLRLRSSRFLFGYNKLPRELIYVVLYYPVA
jgi:hypothetical protein